MKLVFLLMLALIAVGSCIDEATDTEAVELSDADESSNEQEMVESSQDNDTESDSNSTTTESSSEDSDADSADSMEDSNEESGDESGEEQGEQDSDVEAEEARGIGNRPDGPFFRTEGTPEWMRITIGKLPDSIPAIKNVYISQYDWTVRGNNNQWKWMKFLRSSDGLRFSFRPRSKFLSVPADILFESVPIKGVTYYSLIKRGFNNRQNYRFAGAVYRFESFISVKVIRKRTTITKQTSISVEERRYWNGRTIKIGYQTRYCQSTVCELFNAIPQGTAYKNYPYLGCRDDLDSRLFKARRIKEFYGAVVKYPINTGYSHCSWDAFKPKTFAKMGLVALNLDSWFPRKSGDRRCAVHKDKTKACGQWGKALDSYNKKYDCVRVRSTQGGDAVFPVVDWCAKGSRCDRPGWLGMNKVAWEQMLAGWGKTPEWKGVETMGIQWTFVSCDMAKQHLRNKVTLNPAP